MTDANTAEVQRAEEEVPALIPDPITFTDAAVAKVKALMVVPMAAYKFNSRPFIVPATSKITVENVLDKECLIVLDGQEEFKMDGCSKVDFMLSDRKARFIRYDTDFYSRVRDKLVNTL